jgi:hypothetical protein
LFNLCHVIFLSLPHLERCLQQGQSWVWKPWLDRHVILPNNSVSLVTYGVFSGKSDCTQYWRVLPAVHARDNCCCSILGEWQISCLW